MFERRINQQPERRGRGGTTILGTVTLGIIFSTNSVMPAYAQTGPSLESDHTKEVVSPHKAQIPQATPAVLGPAWARKALANFTDSSNTKSPSEIDKAHASPPATSGIAALDVASGDGVVSTESLQSALNRVAPNRQATPPKTEVNNQLENQSPETNQPTNGILSELPQDVAKQIDNSPHVPDKDKAHIKEMVLTAVNYELSKAANHEKSRISTAVMVAQYWTEAGFDGSGLSREYNNLFGVKAGKDVPSDQKVNLPTWEADRNGKPYKTRADFRIYVDIGAAIAHYEEIMTTRGHFEDAVVAYEKYRDVDPAKAAEVFIRGVQFKIDSDGNILGNESRWATDPDYHKKNDSFREKLNLVNLIEQAKGGSLSQAAVSQKVQPVSISELAEQIRAKSAKASETIKNRIEIPVFTFGSPIVFEVKTPEKVDPIGPEPSDIEMIEATEPIITEAPVTDENKVAEEDVPEPMTPPAPSAPSEAEEEKQQTPAAETAPEVSSHEAEREKNIKNLHDKTLQLSWRKGSSKKVEMAPEYAKLIKKMQKEGLYVGGTKHPGVDCGAYVTILMRESGIDPKYNHSGKGGNTTTQEKYLKQSPDWRAVGQVKAGGLKLEDLRPGDVAMLTRADNPRNFGHTFVYVGKIEVEGGYEHVFTSAALDKRAPMAYNDLSDKSIAHLYTFYRHVSMEDQPR